MEAELQELHDAVLGMSPRALREGGLLAEAAAQERVVEALSKARNALQPPLMRFSGAGMTPTRSYTNDAGFDLYVHQHSRIYSGEFKDVHLGISVQFPPGWWGRIVGRSSTFRKLKLLVLEGIIDEGYRGELYVGVTNLGEHPVELKRGDRVCQLLLHRTPPEVELERVAELEPSERGANGFGSTGR